MINIEPLNKEIYEKAKTLGVERIVLNFSGGSDEGYLYVTLYPLSKGKNIDLSDLNAEVENWAYDAYDYSGEGDGNKYGDDIEYDLVNHTASSKEWYMARQEGELEKGSLEIESDDE